MFWKHRFPCALAALGLPALLCAQSPELARIQPFSGSVGESVDFTLEGKNLASPGTLWTDFPSSVQWAESAAKAGSKDATKLLGTLRLPKHPTAPAGFLHLTTATGLSNALFFLVDDLPVLHANGPGKRANALPVKIPHAVAGHTDTAEPEFFRIELEQGKPVSLEVFAARIGSRLDPVLRLLDAEGVPCAHADDSAGLAGDCRLRFTPYKSGIYFVELRDSAFNGGLDYRYHLRIADFPLIETVYPPVATAGSDGLFTALESGGVSAAPPLRISIPARPDATVAAPFCFAPGGPAAQCAVRATDLPVVAEPLEGASADFSAKPLPAACVVVGRLGKPAERDTVSIALKKDDRLSVTPLNREIGSSVALYLAIHAADGKMLASNETQSANAEAELPLNFKAPRDGLYALRIEDISRRGSPALVYAVQVETNPSPMEVTVASNRFVAEQGGVFSAKVTIARKGFTDAVALALESADALPLPEGIRVENHVIDKGKNETLLRVALPREIPKDTVRHFHIRARSTDPNAAWSTRAALKTDKANNQNKNPDPVNQTLAAMPQPPRLLTEALLLCVGPAAPDFFRMEVTDRGVLLPRLVGKGQFVLRQSALQSGFNTNAQIRFENVPEGISVTAGSARGGRITGQVDFVCEIQGPEKPADRPLSFDLVASAEFKGAFKEVRIEKIPVHVVDPVEVRATLGDSPLKPGSTATLRVAVTRHDAANPAPVELQVEGLPAGVLLGKQPGTLAAGDSLMELPLTLAAEAPEGVSETLRVLATTSAAKQAFSTASPPVRLEIKK